MQRISGQKAVQTSTNASVLVGRVLNASAALSVSFTIKNTGANTINWVVYGGNASDLSDKVIVQASAPITAGSFSSYAVTVAPFSYYGVFIESAVADTHGEATLRDAAKG